MASPHLRGLRVLRISNNPIGLDAMRAIGRADLPALRFVDAMSTSAPLTVAMSDWNGSTPDVDWTRARGTLVDELGHLPWLDLKIEPSQDAI